MRQALTQYLASETPLFNHFERINKKALPITQEGFVRDLRADKKRGLHRR